MELSAFTSIAPHLTNVLVVVGLALFLFFGVHRVLIKSGIIPPMSRAAAPPIVLALLKYGFWIALAMIAAGVVLYAMDKGLLSKAGTGPTVNTRETVIRQESTGDCAPNIGVAGGNVKVDCSRPAPR